MRKFLVILFIAFIACAEVAEISDAEQKIRIKNVFKKIRDLVKKAKDWLKKVGVYDQVVELIKTAGKYAGKALCKKITKSDLCDTYIDQL